MRIFNCAIFLAAILPALAQTPEQRTRQALNDVLAGKYDAFYSLFDDTMKKAISLETYSQQAGALLAQFGKPTGIGEPTTRQVNGYTVVSMKVQWAAAALNFIVSWDKEGKVGGTWFRPAAPPEYHTPAYSHPDSFTARDVTVGPNGADRVGRSAGHLLPGTSVVVPGDDDWKLPGTLLIPKGKGPFPGVVLVHGSGPNDRDESVGGVRVFRDLAEGLTSRGIAVLRYDKRTKVYPEKWTADPNLTMTDETVTDAVYALALLRTEPEIDPKRVFVLGHSQGGYMAPRIMKADSKLTGAIVMAGNVRPLEQVILDQNEYMAQIKGNLTDQERAQLEALRKNPKLALLSFPEKYRDDLKDYNPVELAKSVDIPMLILQGERDFQVSMKDFSAWKAGLQGRTNVTFRSFPKLNHLFVAGEGKSTPEEYQQENHLAPEVIEDIAAWIAKRRQ